MAKKDAVGSSEPVEPEAPRGKGRPTPSRKQVEAANARPIVGGQSKEARQQARRQQTDARERARQGMMVGDERYLTARDRGPQRRYARDYVDARWNIGEWLIPVTFVFLLLSFIPGPTQTYTLIFIWGFVLVAALDAVLVGVLLKRRLTAKFGAENLQSGYRFYAAMRSLQFRPLRVPKPQVKRGRYPE